MKKQLLLFAMILLPLVASAEKVEIDGIYYNLITKGNVAEVTSNPDNYTGIVNIPAIVTYNGEEYKVAIIGEAAFRGCNGLTSVSIPNSVTSIKSIAFLECSGLTSIAIPNSITKIEVEVFGGCRALTTIIIPNSVTSIGSYAFRDCTSLASVTIPNSVTSIGESAFYECSGLTSVHISDISIWCKITFGNVLSNPLYYAHHLYLGDEEIKDLVIPNNLSYVGKCAFAGCSGLSSLTIPNSVTSIGGEAFFYCSGLTSLIIPNSVTTIGNGAFQGCSGLASVNIPNSLTSIEECVFNHCLSLTSVMIPNSVTTIGNGAFGECNHLTTVTIGSGIKYIWNQVFESCKELTNVYCWAKNVPYTVPNAFNNSYIEYATLHVPEESMDAYQAESPWSGFGNIIKLDIPKHLLIYMVDGEEYKKYEIEEGKIITPEAAPTKEGYTFSGWSEIPTTMPAHDVTVTGTFTVNKYKLIYKVDGEEYKSYDVEFGATITPEAAPTKEGHSFSGWSEIPETMPAHDVTVTGTFTVNKYKLIYKVDGEEYKSYDVEFGATITPEAAPTKEGHSFSGWSEIPETMPAHDVTVTGTFSVNKYKLIYKVDGEEYKSYDVEYGASITPEAAPTKEGYTFSGWSEIPATMPAHDVTITGTFSVNKYKLIYKVDGAEYKSYDVEFGAIITPEAAPTKEGYTFSGWSEIPETMPAHDVTITGTFTQIDYVVGETTYEVQNDEVSVIDGSKQSGDVEIQTTVVINNQTYKVTSIADNAFKGNTTITSVTIPNSITQIGTNAFEGCTSLSEINIGNAVSSIGSKAFANITSASNAPRRASGTGLKVSCYAESVPSTASNAFENTSISNGTLLVEDNSVTAYKNSAPWSGFGTIMGFKEATGIDAIIVDIETGAKIYSLDGKPQNALQKGINIIRTSNGKTKKVVIK